MSHYRLGALQALYSAEIEVSIISQWDAGWLVELSAVNGTRLTQRFDDGQMEDLGVWLRARADDIAPGWRARC